MEHARILLWDELDLETAAGGEEPQPITLPRERDCQSLPRSSRRLYLVRPAGRRGRPSRYM